MNVKRAVRERSIPLEPSECWKVAVGDLVLCFQVCLLRTTIFSFFYYVTSDLFLPRIIHQESAEQATYHDAHVMEIQRKLHDIRGCRCLFQIRYDHDQTEVTIILTRMFPPPFFFLPALVVIGRQYMGI